MMLGRLIGEVLATPARIADGAANVTANMADVVTGEDSGIGDTVRPVADAAEAVGDAVSDGVAEVAGDE